MNINAFMYLLFHCKFNTKGFMELEYNSLVLPLTLMTKHMKMSKVKGVKKSNIIIILESLICYMLILKWLSKLSLDYENSFKFAKGSMMIKLYSQLRRIPMN